MLFFGIPYADKILFELACACSVAALMTSLIRFLYWAIVAVVIAFSGITPPEYQQTEDVPGVIGYGRSC